MAFLPQSAQRPSPLPRGQPATGWHPIARASLRPRVLQCRWPGARRPGPRWPGPGWPGCPGAPRGRGDHPSRPGARPGPRRPGPRTRPRRAAPRGSAAGGRALLPIGGWFPGGEPVPQRLQPPGHLELPRGHLRADLRPRCRRASSTSASGTEARSTGAAISTVDEALVGQRVDPRGEWAEGNGLHAGGDRSMPRWSPRRGWRAGPVSGEASSGADRDTDEARLAPCNRRGSACPRPQGYRRSAIVLAC